MAREPDRRAASEGPDGLPPEARRRVRRAALVRPMALLVVLIGAVFFAATLVWYIIPITIATYVALVFLAVRDPIFHSRVLEGRGSRRPTLASSPERELENTPRISPEQRARRLPLGQTRQKVEAALEVSRRVVVAIEESDEATRSVLDDAIPKLHLTAERLLDLAERREKAAAEIEALKPRVATPNARNGSPDTEELTATLAALQEGKRAADAELAAAVENLLTLRARAVRVSIESSAAAASRAEELNRSLDEMNLRLDALSSAAFPPKNFNNG